MTAVTSAQAGDWSQTSTWVGGAVPTAEDDVVIDHAVTVSEDIYADTITINDGSLTVAPGFFMASDVVAHVAHIYMNRRIDDTRRVRLDGILLDSSLIVPSVSCIGNGDGFAPTGIVEYQTDHLLVDDPGLMGCASIMHDVNTEGCGPAYAYKKANAVRYLQFVVRARTSEPHYVGQLYRMAEGPFQVLAVMRSAVIKGFIENITPDPSSVGKEFVDLRISVAEGQ